jgi:hypothetical protein
MLIYVLLNVVFLLAYVASYGLGIPFMDFFGEITNDIWGLITAILTPGGTQSDIFSSLVYHVDELTTAGGRIVYHIIGILWIFIPATVSAFVTGRKYSMESTKKSYWGTIIALMFLALLPLIFIAIPGLSIDGTNVISGKVVGSVYWTYWTEPAGFVLSGLKQYLIIVLFAFLNSAFFGGISAASSTII